VRCLALPKENALVARFLPFSSVPQSSDRAKGQWADMRGFVSLHESLHYVALHAVATEPFSRAAFRALSCANTGLVFGGVVDLRPLVE